MSATAAEDTPTGDRADAPRPDANAPGPAQPSGKQAQRTNLSWVEDNQALGIGVAFVLMMFYVAPVFLIAVVAWNTQLFQESNFLFGWFAAFMQSSDSTLNQFHKVLLPIITAISVVAFKSRPTKGMLLLGAFILLAFVVTVFVAVLFDMPATADAIKGLGAFDTHQAKSFFTRIEETLMMYLMMLVGISISNTAR